MENINKTRKGKRMNKKEWKKKAEKNKKKYDKKILDKLNETGYQSVLGMIEGFQKKINDLEKVIKKNALVIAINEQNKKG